MKTANSVVLDYSVDIIQLGESDFILDYGELGNFRWAQHRQPNKQNSPPFYLELFPVLLGSRWSSRDMCLTTLSPIIYRQVNIDIKIPIYLITQVLEVRVHGMFFKIEKEMEFSRL